MTKKKSSSNLVWMDLEMSGLDPEKDVILEVATIVTDAELNILAEGPVIAIHQGENVFESMDEWNTTHHTASGLVDRCRRSRYSTADANWLCYRNIDVSSIKELTFRWYPKLEEFQKEKRHEALNDIRESIAELAYYRKTIFK